MDKNIGNIDAELNELLLNKRVEIKIIGLGGGGNNTINTLQDSKLANVDIIAMNTDAQDLLKAKADYKVLLGKDLTRGLGAGANPEIGEQAALESITQIKKIVDSADAVFLTCGLGGGTGTGAIPVIANMCKKAGILTIAVVTVPFTVEGQYRWDNAMLGLQKLEKEVDSLLVIRNDKLLEIASDLPISAAFKVADNVLCNAIKGIVELVTKPGLVNLDFADLKTITKDSGVALIGIGESDSENRAAEAVDKAMNNPLLDLDLKGARGVLVNIMGGSDFTLDEANSIVQNVTAKVDEDARIIWGAQINNELGKMVKVLVVVTGLHSKTIIDSKAEEGYVDVDDLLKD